MKPEKLVKGIQDVQLLFSHLEDKRKQEARAEWLRKNSPKGKEVQSEKLPPLKSEFDETKHK